MARASTASKIILVAAILLFIDLFFPWQGVDLGEFGEAFGVSGNVSGFNGLGILVAILCIAVIAWEIMLMAGVNINMGTTSPILVSAIHAARSNFSAVEWRWHPARENEPADALVRELLWP